MGCGLQIWKITNCTINEPKEQKGIRYLKSDVSKNKPFIPAVRFYNHLLLLVWVLLIE